MISLIINADDLGCNINRDRGILEAFKQGIVTSASILANGPSFSTATFQVKEADLPIGIHLNLADGLSMTGQIKGLTDQDGLLPGKQKMRQYLASGVCDHPALRLELAAQIEEVFNAGLKPDHIDSHQHCHLSPSLTTMITELATTYGIDAMRNSLPAEPIEVDHDRPLGEELALYRQLGCDAHKKIVAAKLKTPDALWAMPLLNHLDTRRLCHLLENLPPGNWELMTHPGYPCKQGRPFDGPQRQIELQALLADEAQEIIARRRIQLSTFGDLPCAF